MRIALFLILLLAERPVFAQKDSSTTLYFSEIGWSIEVPHKFQLMDTSLRQKMHERGIKAVEEAYQQPVDVAPYQTLFAIRPSLTNYMEAVINPYDPAANGEWLKTSNQVNEIITYTMQQKLGDTPIDTLTIEEEVGGLHFKKFTLSFSLPNNNGTLNMILYAACINGYDFGMNIMYLSQEAATGQDFLSMWRQSKFKNSFTPPKIKRD